MGLLDDAIREHLELKRRHGAAEDEVRRQEQEALGPPRRGEVPEPLAPPAAPGGDDDVDERPGAVAAGSVPPPAAPAEPAPADLYDDEPWLEDPDEIPAPPEARDPGPAAEAPPSRGAASDTPRAEDGEEDVLEETPEFLQETPEHDRLWFEQKPPKDFDFDK